MNAGTGAITGTPTTAATSNFTITATDGLGATGSQAYAVTINAAITVNPATLPNGTVGVAYSQTVSATGGNGSYTFSVSAGSLPAGLSLNAATGAITGTPTAAATSNFTITATDGLGATGARAYSVTINAAITVNPATLPNGTVGTAYSQTVSATGGTGSYTFSVSAGSLPAGLSLNAATGAITGTPTTLQPHRTSRSLPQTAWGRPVRVLTARRSMRPLPSVRRRCQTARSALHIARASAQPAVLAHIRSVFLRGVCLPDFR